MSRSLRVHPQHIETVRLAYRKARFSRQKDLADELEMSLATVSKFFNGKPVDWDYFEKICDRLKLNSDEISLDGNSRVGSAISETTNVHPWQDSKPVSFYVNRPPIETRCFETLVQPGALIRIKGSGLTGKTLLATELLKRALEYGYQTAYLNLHLASDTELESLDQFLKWFCLSVSDSLDLPNRLEDHWSERFSSKRRCVRYFEDLLAQAQRPVVLCIDETDRIFPHQKIAADFLGWLRGVHELAKNRELWQNLRIVLVHSTEVYVPLNIHSSPFNVGLPIELKDFDIKQVQDSARRQRVSLSEAEIKYLMSLVGGHPNLVGKAFDALKLMPVQSLKELLQHAVTSSGIYRDHLEHLWRMISPHPDLKDAVFKVINASQPIKLAPEPIRGLQSLGLIESTGDYAMPRCELYRRYFQRRLLESQAPAGGVMP